jgi:hypothetical protein
MATRYVPSLQLDYVFEWNPYVNFSVIFEDSIVNTMLVNFDLGWIVICICHILSSQEEQSTTIQIMGPSIRIASE